MYLIEQDRPNHFRTKEEKIDYNYSLYNSISDFEQQYGGEDLSESELERIYKKIDNIKSIFKSYGDQYASEVSGSYCSLGNPYDSIGSFDVRDMKYYMNADKLNDLYKYYQNKSNVKAYSHRIRGWRGFEFELNEDFSLQVNTDFGYGSASYFNMTMIYRGIPIVPFSTIVYYRNCNRSEIIDNTRNFIVDESSWKPCFDFAVECINEYYEKGKDNFIKNYIEKYINEVVVILPYLMKTNCFLSYNTMHKLYNNDNFTKFYNVYKDESGIENIDKEAFEKYVLGSDYSTNALNDIYHGQYSEIEKAYYNLYLYISRLGLPSDQLNKGINKLDYYLHNAIDYSMDIDIYKGFTLQDHRYDIVSKLFKIKENLKGLGDLINLDKFNSCIDEQAKLLIKQNKELIEKLEPKSKELEEQIKNLTEKETKQKEIFESVDAVKRSNVIDDFLSGFATSVTKFSKENNIEILFNELSTNVNDSNEKLKEFNINVIDVLNSVDKLPENISLVSDSYWNRSKEKELLDTYIRIMSDYKDCIISIIVALNEENGSELLSDLFSIIANLKEEIILKFEIKDVKIFKTFIEYLKLTSSKMIEDIAIRKEEKAKVTEISDELSGVTRTFNQIKSNINSLNNYNKKITECIA